MLPSKVCEAIFNVSCFYGQEKWKSQMWVNFLIYNYCLSRTGTFTGALSTSHVLQIRLRSARSFVRSESWCQREQEVQESCPSERKALTVGEVIHTGRCDHGWEGAEFSHTRRCSIWCFAARTRADGSEQQHIPWCDVWASFLWSLASVDPGAKERGRRTKSRI